MLHHKLPGSATLYLIYTQVLSEMAFKNIITIFVVFVFLNLHECDGSDDFSGATLKCPQFKRIEPSGNLTFQLETEFFDFLNGFMTDNEMPYGSKFTYTINISLNGETIQELKQSNEFRYDYFEEGSRVEKLKKWEYTFSNGTTKECKKKSTCEFELDGQQKDFSYIFKVARASSIDLTFTIFGIATEGNLTVTTRIDDVEEPFGGFKYSDHFQGSFQGQARGSCPVQFIPLPEPDLKEPDLKEDEDGSISSYLVLSRLRGKVHLMLYWVWSSLSEGHRQHPWLFPLLGGLVVAALVLSLCFIKGRKRHYDLYDEDPECDQTKA